MPEQQERAVFRLEVEGEELEPGKLAIRDLTCLGDLVQRGLERVARVLSNLPGAAPGPLPREIEDATRLVLVGLEPGSAVLAIELPEPQAPPTGEAEESRLFPLPPRELGFQAMEKLVGGLHELETAVELRLPEGWDNSVMEVAEDLAQFSTERRYSITFDARPPRRAQRTAHITPKLAPRFSIRRKPIRLRRTARGRLILIDLLSGRIDIEDAAGHRVQCQFSAPLEPLVKRHVGELVLVSGEEEFDEALGKHGRLELETLAAAGEQAALGEDFWQNPTAAQQAAEQGVGPITSVDALAAPEVFTDEDIERLIEAIRESRSEG